MTTNSFLKVLLVALCVSLFASVLVACGGEPSSGGGASSDHECIFAIEAEIIKEPTCAEEGIILFRCECGKSAEFSLERKEHSFSDGEIIREPVCGNEGLMVCTCKECGETVDLPIPAIGEHEYITEIIEQPTCIESGLQNIRCALCDYEELGVSIPASSEYHAYKEVVAFEGNCGIGRKTNYICEHCGDVKPGEEYAPVGEHTPEEKIITQPTCMYSGYRQIECSVCGFILEEGEVPQKEHEYPSYTYDDNEHYKVCVNGCNQKTEHDFHDFIYKQALKQEEVLEKGERGYRVWVEYSCYCGYNFSSEKITTFEHKTFKLTPAVKPTCRQTGLTSAVVCNDSGCGVVLIEAKILPTVDHNYVNGVCRMCGERASQGLEYTLSEDGTYYILSGIGTCTDEDIFIPKTYKKLPVKVVGSCAFCSLEQVKSIRVGEMVETIEMSAFRECYNLSNVFVPDSVVYIDDLVFYGSYALSKIVLGSGVKHIGEECIPTAKTIYYKGKIEEFELIDNHSELFTQTCLIYYYEENRPDFSGGYWHLVNGEAVLWGDEDYDHTPYRYFGFDLNPDGLSYSVAFINYSSAGITELIIPSTYRGLPITSIKFNVYSTGQGVKKLVLPDTMVEIFGDQLSSFRDLETIVYGKNLKFSESAPSAKKVYYNGSLEDWLNIQFGVNNRGGSSYPLNDAEFYLNGELFTDLIIPSSVSKLSYSNFAGCLSLESVTIGDHVTEMDVYAFKECFNLKRVKLSSSMEVIPAGAFMLTAISSIEIPEGVKEIHGSAFYGTNLRKVVLPDSVVVVGAQVFGGNDYLEEIIVGEGLLQFGGGFSYNNYALKFNYWESSKYLGTPTNPYHVLVEAHTSISNIHKDTVVIGSRAFYQGSVPEVLTIGGKIKTIGNSAFSLCENVKKIIIGDNVEYVGSLAFDTCKELVEVVIGSGVSYIGESAFAGCSKLSKISLSENISYIGYTPVSAQAQCYTEKDGLRYIGNEENPYMCLIEPASKNIVEAIVDENCEFICYPAFSYCEQLEKVVLGNKIKNISDSAFYGCKNLKSILLPEGLTVLSDSMFGECNALESIHIPNSVKKLGVSLFNSCNSLKTVTGGEGLEIIERFAFAGCINLEHFVIGDSVTFVGEFAFATCRGLKSLVIGSNVKKIAGRAFWETYKLTEVINKSPYITLNSRSVEDLNIDLAVNAVTVYNSDQASTAKRGVFAMDEAGFETYTIGDDVYLIGYTGSETKIVLPENVTKIKQYAFYNVNCFEELVISDSVTHIGKFAFYYCDNLERVVIGSGVVAIEGRAFSSKWLYNVEFKDTRGWYRAYTLDDWLNKENGWAMDVTDSGINASLLTYPYYDNIELAYYFYKV